MGHSLLESLPICRLLLRSASLLVPARSRADWLAEWEAELWHVLRSHTEGRRDCQADEVAARSNPTAFCLGAFQDAWWLRQNSAQPSLYSSFRSPLRSFARHGSPAMCLLSLAAWVAAALMLALCLPSARKAMLPAPYPNAANLVLISPSPSPSIRLADYRSWQTSTRPLFTELAYYQPLIKRVHIAPHRTAEMSIIRANANLFNLLKMPSIALEPQDSKQMQGMILSESAWHEYFDGDPAIAGRVIEVAGRRVRIAWVLAEDRWRLPGRADAWMIADESQMDALSPNSRGFVLAEMRPSAFPSGTSGRHWMTVYRANGDSDNFECVSLAEQARQPFSIYLFTLFIAVLALPATTPLPLGEYPARAERLGWSVRVRRWLFLAAKLALILPLVYCASIDLAYGNIMAGLHSVGPVSSQYLQLASSFFGLLFAFRWALRDQRGRCPVCLRLLTNPARVGEASRNFLAWNGTELICAGGHGLPAYPGDPHSWFSTQRWLYLDPSWSSLFTDAYVAPAGVL